jgi:hypothetical protein
MVGTQAARRHADCQLDQGILCPASSHCPAQGSPVKSGTRSIKSATRSIKSKSGAGSSSSGNGSGSEFNAASEFDPEAPDADPDDDDLNMGSDILPPDFTVSRRSRRGRRAVANSAEGSDYSFLVPCNSL